MEPFNDSLRARAKSISKTEEYSQLVLEHYYPESVEAVGSMEGKDETDSATISITDSLMSTVMMPLTISNDIVVGAFSIFSFETVSLFVFAFHFFRPNYISCSLKVHGSSEADGIDLHSKDSSPS